MMSQADTEQKKPRRLPVVIPTDMEGDLAWFRRESRSTSDRSAVIRAMELGLWTAKTTRKLAPPADVPPKGADASPPKPTEAA